MVWRVKSSVVKGIQCSPRSPVWSGESSLVGSGKSVWSGESSGVWRVDSSGVWEINVVWGVQWDLESPKGSERSDWV